jgi:hypothetical protein
LTTPNCLQAVRACLDDRDPAVSGEAARALAAFGAAAAPALPRLRQALAAADADTRAGAAYALGELGLERAITVQELCALLGDREQQVFSTAARALAQLGVPLDARSVQRLLAGLETALVDCDYATVDTVTRTLLAVSADPEQCLRDYFVGRDEELARLALGSLEEQRNPTTAPETNP